MTEFLTSSHGDRVAYDLRGSGPAVVFVAGAGPFRAIDPETTATAEIAAGLGLTTLVYDRLGRGESGVEGRIGLDREIAALASLIEVAGGSAVLCGHSSGCSIALAAAAAGLRVDGLALWEAPLGPPGGGAQAWADGVGRLLDGGNAEAAVELYMHDMPPEFLAGVKQSPMWQQFIVQAQSLRPDGESLAWAESAPHAELFEDIRVPVVAMMGEETFEEMPVAAEFIVEAIPGAVSKRMPGADHSWVPEPMAVELAAFVKDAVARGSAP